MSDFRRLVSSGQRKSRLIALELDGTTPALNIGSSEASVVDGGADGIYIVTLTDVGARAGVVVATPSTADVVAHVSAKSASSFTVTCVDATDGTTAKDSDLEILCLVFDSEEEQ
jgi:hypothetical protein